MGRSLPPPPKLGLPAKFPNWRKSQDEAVTLGLDSKCRTIGYGAPTGFGKTLTYMAQAHLSEGRTLINTATKGLQTQLMSEFASIGLVQIMGKANYRCPQYGNCAEGYKAGCAYRKTSICGYTDAYRIACSARLVVANYKYSVMITMYGQGLGQFQQMVCDEAHQIPNELGDAMHVTLRFGAADRLLRVPYPVETWNMREWTIWAVELKPRLESELELAIEMVKGDAYPPASLTDRVSDLRGLLRSIRILAFADPDNWIVDQSKYGYVFDPINPAVYAERVMYRGIKKLYLYSATLRPKTMRLSGIFTNMEYHEYPSCFDREHFRIYQVDTQRVDSKTTNFRKLHGQIDNIIRARQDRRGIIHTVSKPRRDQIIQGSKFHECMETNYKSDITAEIVERFKKLKPPTVLVSASIATGWDFPGEACEYQIICKVPFPDSRTRITAARQKADPEYGANIAMQQLVQACGRAERSEKDRCEVFIIDDHIKWFLKKFRHLCPTWFYVLVQYRDTLPKPAPKLLTGGQL